MFFPKHRQRAQSNLLQFTILSTQAEGSPKLIIVTKPLQKGIFVTVCYARSRKRKKATLHSAGNDISHFLREALVTSKVIPTPARAAAAPSTKSKTSISVGRITIYFVVGLQGELKSSTAIMTSFVRDPRSP